MLPAGISIIIPNYNGLALLPQILPCAIEALQQSGQAGEIIVVDDASTDQSVAVVTSQFPSVRIICCQQNGGFSKSANQGIMAAAYSRTLLLNSDVKLEPDYFKHLLPYFERPDVFGVMGRIVGWEDEIVQDGAKFPSFHGAKIKTARNYLCSDESFMQNGLLSMYLSGANALMDTVKLRQLGGFNEIFSPFYVEDYELSLRAWRMGWTCFYEHKAVCRHRVSDTIKTTRRKRFVDMIYDRNKMILHALHLQGGILFLWYLQLLPEALIRLLTGRLYFFESIYQFFQMHGKVRRQRKAFAALAGPDMQSVEQVMQQIRQSIPCKDFRIF
jgi:GT2 family glycosyltransferase